MPSGIPDRGLHRRRVLSVERWVLAPLRNRTFHSLAELNAAIAEMAAELNARAFRGEPTSRADLFAELERDHLRPLPAGRFELPRWRPATVHIDYHVEAGDGHYYSVPHRYVRQKVECRITSATVEVFKGNARIASHGRETAGADMSPTPCQGTARIPCGRTRDLHAGVQRFSTCRPVGMSE